ncbi:hypothetical protein GCM10018792_28920 [Streptomyces rubradiris]|nr:hypothetical protein GCM10018792_28920 [Streptomyces rubradiris]
MSGERAGRAERGAGERVGRGAGERAGRSPVPVIPAGGSGVRAHPFDGLLAEAFDGVDGLGAARQEQGRGEERGRAPQVPHR